MTKTESAEVLWWNADKVYLRCPDCYQIHCLDFIGYRTAPEILVRCLQFVSDVQPPTYQLIFPVEGQYTMDKTTGLNVRIGEDPKAYFQQFEDLLQQK